MKKSSMFEKYPDVVEVDDLRKMLGGISRRLAYRLLAEQEIRCVKVKQSLLLLDIGIEYDSS